MRMSGKDRKDKTDKAKAIVLIEKLRLIESELYKLTSRYGVKTVQELDQLVKNGAVAEMDLGEDLFVFDYLANLYPSGNVRQIFPPRR
jgi:hypothetical protein